MAIRIIVMGITVMGFVVIRTVIEEPIKIHLRTVTVVQIEVGVNTWVTEQTVAWGSIIMGIVKLTDSSFQQIDCC